MRTRALCLMTVLACFAIGSAQESHNHAAKKSAIEKDVDPLALHVLKAATDPIKQSQAFSFRALVSREHLGSNGQIITLFHVSDVTVQRPDKIHIEFRGRGKTVQMFYNAGQSVLYTPSEKLYTTISGPNNIDATLADLEKRDVFIPISNFLESDPYQSLADDVTTGYVVGKVMLFDQEVHHLAFTEPDAEWQLWVIGGEHPQVRRMEIIDNSKPERPRIAIDFLDWNLNATPTPDLFTFQKPADAQQIDLLKQAATKK